MIVSASANICYSEITYIIQTLLEYSAKLSCNWEEKMRMAMTAEMALMIMIL